MIKKILVILIICYFIINIFIIKKSFLIEFFSNNINDIINEIKNISFSEYNKYDLVKVSKIPSVIYTYWHDEILPIFIQNCINSWKKYNPTWQIIILNKTNITKYISFDIYKLKFAKTQQQISDFIRLYLIKTHGGFWLDATIYINRSLDWVHSYQVNENSEFVGYKINGTYKYEGVLKNPIVENWFMAAIPNSQFIKDWYDIFYSINNYDSIDNYVKYIKETTDLKGIDSPNYLTMHIACLYILEKSNNKYKLSLLEAEKGPYLYLVKLNWDYKYLLDFIKYFKGKESPIVKYRGGERNFIINNNLVDLY